MATAVHQVKIRIKFGELCKFCTVELNDFTKASFIRDGTYYFVYICVLLSFAAYATHFLLLIIVSSVVGDQFDPNSDFQIIDNADAIVPMEDLKDIILKYEHSVHFVLRVTYPHHQRIDNRLAVEVKQACNISMYLFMSNHF